MNVRTSTNPAVTAASRVLARINARHPWSHNDHFHDWIVRRLPDRRERAVDVGCGEGALLVRLARHFTEVRGTDRDEEMRRCATSRCDTLSNVSVSGDDLADLEGSYDLITMVAVLHHLDLDAALRSVHRLLAPGGRFLVVGLAKPTSRSDMVWDIASAVANPIIGFVKHPVPADIKPSAPPFPVMDPQLSTSEIRAKFDEVMPGTRLRRRLCFRYTAEWTKPHRT